MAASTRVDGLRSADIVMAPWRAGASFPTPLSFSRSLLRKMAAERWRVMRLAFELDAEGRGEAVYRIDTPTTAFHFLAVSDVFPADQKVDRAFGINWDVSAVLCEGPWTTDRRALLAAEAPKQYDGRYPADVLCFCRGNRSERIFDHVVDALAAGLQPDTALLASVGYLLRSTAFAGNGLFGMRPFEALGPAHPLGATYHAQILAAYLLRTFVFDLVEHIAVSRSADAVRLDRGIKRYLGLGNSAGLGLVPFIMTHPQVIHQWCLAQESAFAEALSRPVDAAGLATLRSLIDRARRYFRQDGRDGNGIFADYARLAAEFDAIRSRLDGFAEAAKTSWRVVRDAALPPGHHPETEEALLGLLLELFPDIVARWDARMIAEEGVDLDPAMTTLQLATVVRETCAWVPAEDLSGSCPHFWYYPLESPYEPRRGLRGTGTSFETETPMDLPRLLPRLVAALATVPDDTPVGVFLARHPCFSLLARRVQSLAGQDFAELRANSLAPDYLPFAACRFLLAFYGMEKYDPRLPRSTKGALLQGAPLPEEVAEGIEGSWPFPLAPDTTNVGTPAIIPQRLVEQPEIAIGTLKALGRRPAATQRGGETVFPAEMRKLLGRAALGAGLDAVAADAVVRLAHSTGDGWIDGTLAALERRLDGRLRHHDSTIDALDLPDFAIAPRVLDLACGLAGRGVGVATGIAGSATPLLGALALWGAERGYLTAVADARRGSVALAGGTKGALWRAAGSDLALEALRGTPLATITAALAPVLRDLAGRGGETRLTSFAVACRHLRLPWTDARPSLLGIGHLEATRPDQVAEDLRRVVVGGFQLSGSQFERLSRLAKRGLLPPELEPLATGQVPAAA